ncbi:hypothetical protein SAMN04487965_3341 [Microbulbifer donghaiensis]|uniref:DUF4230 domain-containing protein n=1 Tax=Microbulbifer donghaiensis TaxID=494016 RepID=A0A1M5H9D8_9GAMM|nr:hypothetical protein [Microbulbifer donghaiensis]SHG12535.1 hypothetical protein SAMN04487965_3341 [Microbulbifer donghaiensis]
MNNQKGSVLIGAIVVAAILGVALFFYVSKFEQAKKDYEDTRSALEHLKKLNEISVSEGIQVKQAIFEFVNIPTEISFRFKEEYDRPKGGSGVLDEQVDILYKTDYIFTYGYDLEDWAWCASLSEVKPSFVTVRKPKAIWTNKNKKVAPKEWFTIEGIHYQEELGAKIQSDAANRLSDKLVQISSKHLSDDAMNSNMERALKEFLMEIMNSSYEKSNPVSGIDFVTNLDSACKKI